MNIRFGNFLFSNGGRLEFYAWELSPFFQFLECVCNRFSFFRRCYCVSFFLSEVPKKTPLGFLSRGTFLGMGKIRRKSPRGRLKAVFGGSQYKTLTPPRAGAWSATKKPVFMRIWGLCRKSKCPRPPGTHLPLFCSLGEAGGAGAEPPQNLPAAAAPVQTVLPLK